MLNRWKSIGCFFLALVLVIFSELVEVNSQIVIASDRTFVNRENQARELLEKGIDLYKQESFALAGDVWLKSASLYNKQQDILGEALALNNLALAHQHLGEWEQSQQAIAKSLELLNKYNVPKTAEYWNVLAKTFNTQGNWQWYAGKTEFSLDSWQKAEEYYVLADYQLGIVKARINQAKALQAEGFTVRAVELLTMVNNSLQQESNPQLKATGLRYLGISLRNLGKLEESAANLEQSINIIDSAPDYDSRLGDLIWLELGNTYRKQRERALITGKEREAKTYFTQAIKAYQKAQTSDSLLLHSQLNQLSLLIEAEQYAEAENLAKRIDYSEDRAINRGNIYTSLNYARSLTCLQSPVASVPLCNYQSGLSNKTNTDYTQAIKITKNAIANSRAIKDTIAEAHALRQLAEIYELQGDLDTAYNYTQQALLLLEGKSAADIVYRLQWQLGRILQQKEESDSAITAYSQAIASLALVRDNILLIDPLVQFSFRDRIEPVYREYTSLLLSSDGNNFISESNLKQGIEAINALQLAELENFLGCDLSELIRIDETTVDNTAVQIYPIILSDRLVTIIDLPGKPLTYRETLVSQQQITETILALQDSLNQPGKTPEVLKQSQQLYQWAIAPIEPLLKANPQIKTLVFVPDGLLRNIPLGVLYDGEQYLIEQDYALVISPQLELFAPAPSANPLKVFTGGVEISQTIEGIEFPAIAQVEEELNRIGNNVNTNNPLLNTEFTEAQIQQKLQQGDFSAIHWKTHGVFSSNPTDTFIVAYQDSIKANELQSLIQTASQDGQKPLELLVLSACETAKGDNRAILGLAGLTVKTGARTALSTLWRADDRATTLLMTKFYQQLQQPGISKASALQQAQLSLIQEEGYFAPYFWGTYVLVGNWL